jgi:myotubularin-related protein 1/2
MSATDDPLQAALDEAASLMNELELDVVDVSLTEESADLHPLHDHFLSAPPPPPTVSNTSTTEEITPVMSPSLPQNPTQQMQQPILPQPPQQQSLPPQQMQYMPQQQHLQSQRPLQPVQYPPASTPSTATSTAQRIISADTWKMQTRQFASNIATMAQRGLQQVQEHSNFLPTPSGLHVSSPSHQNHPAATMITPLSHMTNSGTNSHLMNQPMLMTPNRTVAPEPTPVNPEQQQLLLQTHVGDLMQGEKIILFVSNLPHVSDSRGVVSSGVAWCGVVTYYRLLLFPLAPDVSRSTSSGLQSLHPSCLPALTPPRSELLQLPLTCIEKIEKSTMTAQQQMLFLTVTSKLSGYWIRLACPTFMETQKVAESLETYAFPGRRNLGYLFAFECQREAVMQSLVQDEQGQKRVTLEPTPKRFDAVVEYTRLLGSSLHAAWKIWTQCNAQYQLCPSYPNVVVGPSSLDELDVMVRQCAAFRSEYRWPALTWGNSRDGASIWRCAQPKMGLQGNRSSADEYFLQQIMEQAGRINQQAPSLIQWSRTDLQALTGSSDLSNWYPEGQLKLLDLRPRASAMANRTAGYGYENTSYYPGTTLQFCNIGNIHAVRDAYQKISAVALQASDLQWQSAIDDSKWLSSIRLIWAAAWETAFWVHVHRMPVLLHCSHGWDRTSQVAALAQLLLDGHYRTRKGFATLVEKDFHAFGHPFHTRCAHGEGGNEQSVDEGQVSPIFLQFLDGVYQLVRLYPDAFEFTTKYLLELSNHIYSCRFGTFLCDTEREREVAANLRQRTQSVWDALEARPDLCNEKFQDSDGVLLIPLPLLLRSITLWNDRHALHGPKPVLRALPNELEQEMWRRLLCGEAVEGQKFQEEDSPKKVDSAEDEKGGPTDTAILSATSFTIDD